ncbi:MAG: glutamine synthetase beta-grasp domain-containing protein [Alphaproteobacteria bacterium]|nr:glutamine synthetase beta-grasp domain-containing protein [Alphaproteobacteria bacterium]
MTMPMIAADLAALAAAKGCEVVDLRFTDLLGRWLHVALWAKGLRGGGDAIYVAASSIAGWGRLEASDLLVRPDLATAFRDPFASRATLVVIGELCEPTNGLPWRLDSRSTARRAFAALRESGVADDVRLGVELEFYLFDDVRFHMSPTQCFFAVRERDSLENTRRRQRRGNPGHRVAYPALHLCGAPLDQDEAWRTELVAMAETIGLAPTRHQHEAGPGQQELGLHHDTLLRAMDKVQIAKWLVHGAARAAGRTATFMPKPLPYQPGSGLHLNLSLWRDGRPLFAGPDADRLRRRVLGGVFAHARALNALTNPSTNGYRRLAALYGGTAALAYGPGNRAVPVRLPSSAMPSAQRLELRFPDATANPYLAAAAILMAGLDGIRRDFDAGPPATGNPRGAEGGDELRRGASSGFALDLREAVAALDADRAFLCADGVVDPLLIDTLLAELDRQHRVNRSLPHPNEYYLYFSA